MTVLFSSISTSTIKIENNLVVLNGRLVSVHGVSSVGNEEVGSVREGQQRVVVVDCFLRFITSDF